jgi:hypothetical protein
MRISYDIYKVFKRSLIGFGGMGSIKFIAGFYGLVNTGLAWFLGQSWLLIDLTIIFSIPLLHT